MILVVYTYYHDILGARFVEWDDDVNVYNNPYFNQNSHGNLGQFWRHPYLSLYIPLSYTFLLFIARISAMGPDDSSIDHTGPLYNPYLFHLSDLILHSINVLLVFALLLRVTRQTSPSLAGSLVFALHPLQVESVAWISETRGLLCAVFVLLSINTYLAFTSNVAMVARHWRYCLYAAAVVFFIASLLCKPSSAFLPVALVALDVLTTRRSWKAALLSVLPLALVSAAAAILVCFVQQAPLTTYIPIVQRPFVALGALSFYLFKVLCPVNLCADYGQTPPVVLHSMWIRWAWMVPVVLAALAVILKRRVPWLGAAAVVSVVFLLPVLGLVPFIYQQFSTVADRYVYLAMIGPALVVAAGCALMPRMMIWSVCAGVTLVFGSLTSLQAAYWQDTISLWSHTLEVNPTSRAALNNLAESMESSGNYSEAIALYQRAEEVDPSNWKVYNNYGSLLDRLGQYNQAVDQFNRGLRLYPQNPYLHGNLAVVLSHEGDNADALNQFRAALRLDPQYANAWSKLCMLLMAMGKPEIAAQTARSALKIHPDYIIGHVLLGDALARMGQDSEASQEYHKAQILDPNDSSLLDHIAAFNAQTRTMPQPSKPLADPGK